MGVQHREDSIVEIREKKALQQKVNTLEAENLDLMEIALDLEYRLSKIELGV